MTKYLLALGLILTTLPAYAGVAGTVLVANNYPGARDNPLCYAPLISTGDPTKLKGPPCKTIQYACNLVASNPGGYGIGGAGDWRLLFGDNLPTATYVEQVKCTASGFKEANGTVHYFSFIAHSGATRIHCPPGVHGAALTFIGDYIKFGKLEPFGVAGEYCEGIHWGEPNVRHKDGTQYYNTGVNNTYSIGVHVENYDGWNGNNSAIIEAGADGSPCMKIENSTMVHIDSNSMKRCGTQFGTPLIKTNGVEIWNSAGATVGPSMAPDPSYVKYDLQLFSSPNSTVSGNNAGYKCAVTPASDLTTDVVSPAGTCVGK